MSAGLSEKELVLFEMRKRQILQMAAEIPDSILDDEEEANREQMRKALSECSESDDCADE